LRGPGGFEPRRYIDTLSSTERSGFAAAM